MDITSAITHALEFCRTENITDTAKISEIVNTSIMEYTDANSVEYDLLTKVMQVTEAHGDQLAKDAMDDLFTIFFARTGNGEEK